MSVDITNVTYAPRRQLEAQTRLGPVLVELPGDWVGQSPKTAPGSWMFDDPGNTCTLYLSVESLTYPRSVTGPEHMALLVKANVDDQRRRFSAHDFAVDEADRGVIYRAGYKGEDEYGPICHEARTRYIDIGDGTILSLNFLFVYDARLENHAEINQLLGEGAGQFDLATGQIARRHGFDLDRDPTILWRMTELDMGVGTFRFCKPLEMLLECTDGHEKGSNLWIGTSPDSKWELQFERSTATSDRVPLDEIVDVVQAQVLETVRGILPLKAAPIVEEIGAQRIIEVLFGRPHDAHDHVRRWYVIVQYTNHVRLHRIAFGCREQDVETKPIRALTQFCRDWADDLVGIYEPVSDETRERD